MLQKFATLVDGVETCYWSNMPDQFKRSFLFLSSGFNTGEQFVNIDRYFNHDDLILAIDYPGRGGSMAIKSNKPIAIAKHVAKLLSDLNLNTINVVAYSYGTQIALELLNFENILIQKLLLVAPGQYFNKATRIILRTYFEMIAKSNALMELTRKILLKTKVFSGFPTSNLNHLNDQWIETIKFEIPDISSDTSTMIVYFTDDKIVDRRYGSKVEKIFYNPNIQNFSGKHPISKSDFEKMEKDILPSFLK